MNWQQNLNHEIQLGNFSEALKIAESALESNPNDINLLTSVALCQAKLNNFNESLMLCRSIVGRGTFPVSLVSIYIFVARTLGYFDEAIAIGQQVLAQSAVPEISASLAEFQDRPFFPSLQGAHAPERQVYMSSVVDKLKGLRRSLNILEIGSYMGASMITWARSVERLTELEANILCLDSWEKGTNTEYQSFMSKSLSDGSAFRIFSHAQKFIGPRVNVIPLREKSCIALPLLRSNMFDIVYIDGGHLYDDVKTDIMEASRLVCDGGYICGDDLELQSSEIEISHAQNNLSVDFLYDPKSKERYHPGVTLAVAEKFGSVSAFHGFWTCQKIGEKSQNVNLDGRGILPAHWPQEFQNEAKRIIANDGFLELI